MGRIDGAGTNEIYFGHCIDKIESYVDKSGMDSEIAVLCKKIID